MTRVVIDELAKGRPEAFRDDDLTLDVYVDQVTGSDANDGLSPTTALATLKAIRRKFGVFLDGISRTVIHILNPTPSHRDYEATSLFLGGGNMAVVNTFSYRGPAMTQFIPGTGPATAALDATPAERVDQAGNPSGAGQRTRINFSSAAPGWTPGDLAGSFCRFSRGADKVFHELPITENGADFFIVDTLGIAGTLQPTDQAEIVEPAVRIVGSPDPSNLGLTTIFGHSSWDPEAGFIDPESNGAAFERLAFGSIFSKGAWGVSFDRCQASGGFFSWVFVGGSVGIVNSIWKDTSLAFEGCNAASAPEPRRDSATDPLFPGQVAFGVPPVVGIQMAGGAGFRGGLNLGSGNNVLLPRGAAQYVVTSPLALSVYDAVFSSGIDVRQNSQLVLDNGAKVLGKGNANYGLRAKMGGVIRVPGGSLTTITGALGDMKVGRCAGQTATYGTGPGQFQEAAGINGNLHDFANGDSSRITTDPTFEP